MTATGDGVMGWEVPFIRQRSKLLTLLALANLFGCIAAPSASPSARHTALGRGNGEQKRRVGANGA